MLRLSLILLTSQLSAAPPISNTANATKAVRRTVDEIVSALNNKTLTAKERRDKTLAAAEAFLDLPLMAKLTLGRRHWTETPETTRLEFVSVFTKHVKNSYLEKLELYTDEEILVSPGEARGDKVLVKTSIRSKGKAIGVDYKLYEKGGVWKAYDVEIEGVSMVKSFGSQYGEFLQENPISKLIEKLRESERPGPRGEKKSSDPLKEKKPSP